MMNFGYAGVLRTKSEKVQLTLHLYLSAIAPHQTNPGNLSFTRYQNSIYEVGSLVLTSNVVLL